MSNVKIIDLAIYHPDTHVDNEVIYNHFDKKGQDVRSFLSMMGREKRYLDCKHEETPLTMAIKATDKVLEKTGLLATELDLIIYTTQTPETLLPSNAVRLFNHIKGKHETIIYDLNANCAGMTVALEQACQYMMGNKRIQKALIVGSDLFSSVAHEDDPLVYGCFSDGAVAMIIGRTEEENIGYIDSVYHVNTVEFAEKMMLPAEGFTKAARETGDFQHVLTIPFDGSSVLEATYEMFETLFERNNVKPSEVKYCFSQFALSNIERIKERFNLQEESVIYVGNEFGYTGTGSPFLALHEGIKQEQIKRGNYLMFWTIGTGYELIAILCKY